MGLFSRKEEPVYKVYSATPKDENNTTEHWTHDKRKAKEKQAELSQRETNVKIKIKKVRS